VGTDAWLAALVPAAVLAVGLLLTRRLTTDDPLPWPPPKKQRKLRPFVLVGLLLPVAAFFLAFYLDPERLILWTAAAATVGLAVRALDLGWRRQAGRAVVASCVPLAAVVPLIAGIPDRGGPTLFHPSFLLLAAIVPAALLTRPLTKTWTAPILTILAAVPMVVWLALSAAPSRAPRPTEVGDWLSRFDRPVKHMLEWDTFGRAAAWLESARGLTLDLRVPEKVLRDSLLRGDEVHPTVLAGALEAGLLGPSDLGHYTGSDQLRRARLLLDEQGPLVVTAQTPADVRLLVARGEARGEQRERLVEALAKAWPQTPKWNRLEDASNLCRLLVLLDAAHRIKEQKSYLHGLLERTWCEDAPSYSTPGGFTPNEDDGEHPSEADATWHALEVISHVGIPDSIDLAETRRYLRSALGKRERSHRLDPLRGDDEIAWMRFESEHDPTPSAARRIADAGPLLGTCAFLIFTVLLLLRARPVRIQHPEPPKLPPWAATPEAEAQKDLPLR
jgi:hypothetical protein